MRWIIPFFLFFVLSLRAFADGVVIPATAFPAKVMIPDQRAAISFSNGLERLVIETRFSGAGTNFAWVVPLPSQPEIEEATSGMFPTLQFLCRPQVIHNVPLYYAGILALIGIASLICFVRPGQAFKWTDFLSCICAGLGVALGSNREVFSYIAFIFVTGILLCDVILIRVGRNSAFAVFGFTLVGSFCLCGLLLPAGGSLSQGVAPLDSSEKVAILGRKMVGVYETTTIGSRDAEALQAWLSANGFSVPTNAEPIIASYVKEGWVFVATKVLRPDPASATSVPHPLSFTFKTGKPVYPMRLTGLNSGLLNLDLYVFGGVSAAAPNFKVESSVRREILHPALGQWFGSTPVITKLSATLSSDQMNEDVWINLLPAYVEHSNRFYSRHGALASAANLGAYVLVGGLLLILGLALLIPSCRKQSAGFVCLLVVASAGIASMYYASLPQIEVRLVKGGFRHNGKSEVLALRAALRGWDLDCTNITEVRTAFREIISSSTNSSSSYPGNWDNELVGGQFREEDSPGNYLLRETNNHVKLILVDEAGREMVRDVINLPLQH